MIDWVKVLLERRLKRVGVQTLIDILIVGSVELLKVKLTLLVVLSLLLLLLKHRHESRRAGVVQSHRVLVQQLDQQCLVVGQVSQSCTRKMTRVWLSLIYRWHHLTHSLQTWMILLKQRIHVRLQSLDIALDDGEVVRVFLTGLVDSVVSRVRRFIRTRFTAETGFWFGFALLR